MVARILAVLFSVLILSNNAALAAEGGKPHDMSAMWKNSLARQQLSSGAVFDEQGALWLAQVKDGHVLVSQSADQGKTFSDPVKVNAQPEAISASGETRPKIRVAASGNLYVSWTQSLEVPFAGNIRFSRSLDGGTTFSQPVTVNDNLDPVTHRFEAMEINRKGQIFLAWLDKRDAASARSRGEPFSGISVFAAMSDDGGKSFHPNVKVADHTCECCRVAMAIDSSDTPVVVWRHIFGKNVRDHGMARLYPALLSGKEQAAADAIRRITSDNWEVEACPHHGPALSIAGQVMHMTWFNQGSVRSGLFYAHSADGGKTFSAPLALGDPARQPGHADVLALGNDVYLAWKEFDGEASAIQGMHSRDGGNTWGRISRLAGTHDESAHPLLIANRQQVYLSWSSKAEGYRLIAWQDAQ